MSGLIDSSLGFGIQNWFFVKKDGADGTYDYFIFQNKKSTVLIMKADKVFENVLYYVANGDFDTIVAGKAGYTYLKPGELKDPKLS